MATEREQRVMDAARALVLDHEKGCQLAPGLLALVGAVTAPDDTRAQAGECDVAAIGARLHAIDREGVRSIDDALVMGAAITDPSTGDVEWILRHAPDVIDCLADAVRRFTAAAADAFADRVRACHAAAARVERYTLPAEVLALIADVPALLDALAREREAHAAEVAAAVAAERERDAADARHAALAGAVRAERALTSQYEGAWAAHIAGGAPLDAAEGVLALSDRLDAARATVDALLRGAPGGYVPARVVREYLRARDAHAMPRPEATTAALRDDVIAARTALDAALLAATTTPKESL